MAHDRNESVGQKTAKKHKTETLEETQVRIDENSKESELQSDWKRSIKDTIYNRKQIGKSNLEKPKGRLRQWSRDFYRQIYMFANAVLNRYILTLPIKTSGSMRLHLEKQIIQYNEMNDQIFDIDMNI
jgi:hypothetical protein